MSELSFSEVCEATLHELSQADPIWWIETVLGVTLQDHQAKMIRDTHYANKPQRCWATCNSALKSFSLAAYALYWLFNYYPSKVVAIGPTATQLDKVFFGELRSIIKKAPYELGGVLLPKAMELTIAPDHYLLGLSASVPEALQGQKSPRLLIIIDEATGIKDPYFEALLGNLASGEAVILLAANPIRATGQVFRAFHSAASTWFTIRVDAFDTANFVGLKSEFDDPKTSRPRKIELLRQAPIRCPYLVSPHWAANLLEEYGEDSDMFRVRVRGLFPSGDPNQLITMGDLVDSNNRWLEIDAMSDGEASQAAATGKRFPWWRYRHLYPDAIFGGLDVARLGANRSVLSGRSSDLVSMPQITYSPQKTNELNGHVARDLNRLQFYKTNVDEPGLGAGPCDNLPAMAPGIVPFNGGKSAFNPKKFPNLRSEQYWHLRHLLRKTDIAIPPSDQAMGGLTSLRYSFLPKGERRVETKDEVAARGITASMDEADSHMMSYARVPGSELIKPGHYELASKHFVASVPSLAAMEDDDEWED